MSIMISPTTAGTAPGAAPNSPSRPISPAEAAPAIPAAGLDLGPGRRRVTQQDFDLYRALVGGPSAAADADASQDDFDDPEPEPDFDPPPAAAPSRKLGSARRLSRTLVLQLVDCYNGLAARAGRPELTDVRSWARRLSDGVRHKVQGAQARFVGRRFKRAGRGALGTH